MNLSAKAFKQILSYLLMLKEIILDLLIYLTLIADITIILILIYFVFLKFNGKIFSSSSIGIFLRKNYLIFGFIVSLVATLGSLFYSDIMGYEPCTLCWYQRILIYPQVLLFGLAIFRKDRKIYPYILALSIPGALIAFYHYMLQLGIMGESVVCSIVGYSVSCSENFFTNFGYITIPMMALTSFILIIILALNARKN